MKKRMETLEKKTIPSTTKTEEEADESNANREENQKDEMQEFKGVECDGEADWKEQQSEEIDASLDEIKNRKRGRERESDDNSEREERPVARKRETNRHELMRLRKQNF